MLLLRPRLVAAAARRAAELPSAPIDTLQQMIHSFNPLHICANPADKPQQPTNELR